MMVLFWSFCSSQGNNRSHAIKIEPTIKIIILTVRSFRACILLVYFKPRKIYLHFKWMVLPSILLSDSTLELNLNNSFEFIYYLSGLHLYKMKVEFQKWLGCLLIIKSVHILQDFPQLSKIGQLLWLVAWAPGETLHAFLWHHSH